MSGRNHSIAHQLHNAQVAIDNTLKSPVILERVSDFGYSMEKMEVGRSLQEAAAAAVHARKAAFGAQQRASAALKEREKEAFAAYQDLAKVARAVYANTPEKLVALGLDTKMPRTTAAFILAGYKLFENAQLKVDELAAVGYDADRLASERAKIVAYEEANAEQELAKGAAQHATQQQKSALKACNDWVRVYLQIARVALRGDEQFLEKLGITVRATRTAAQREGVKKAAATRAAKKAAEELEAEPEEELV